MLLLQPQLAGEFLLQGVLNLLPETRFLSLLVVQLLFELLRLGSQQADLLVVFLKFAQLKNKSLFLSPVLIHLLDKVTAVELELEESYQLTLKKLQQTIIFLLSFGFPLVSCLKPPHPIEFCLLEVLLKLVRGEPLLGVDPHASELIDYSFVDLAIVRLFDHQCLEVFEE